MKITAAVVPSRSAPFQIETLDLAPPIADEVLVRIVASGMCHTDLHARDGYFPNLPYPVVCGHEGAGIVEQVGAAVTDLAPGDPVVISFPWCGECEPCRAERISYCTNARALKSGGRRADGSNPISRDGAPIYSCFFQQSSFATFALAPAKDVVKIRRDAPIELLGPLGCGLQTGAGAVLNVMKPAAGQSIAIYGVGGVGLAGLMAARVAGCDPIIAIDRLPERLALARELGATHTLESGPETLAEIRKITGGGTHFALETSAIPNMFRLAVDGLRGLGTCILVGSARAGTEVSFEMPWLQGGRTVRGVIQGDSRPREFIPRLVDLFMAGRFPLDRLVTRYDWLASTLPPPTRPRARRSSRSWSCRIDRRDLLCHLMCRGPHMATNLSIDPQLLERALEVSGERTKKAAVTKALEEFIARRRQRHLLDLMGQLEWDDEFDYKTERTRR